MNISYSQTKNQQNIEKHGISFELIEEMEQTTSYTKQDLRNKYNEPRFISYGFIRNRLHILIWTLREYKMRAISLRKANKKEEREYYDKMGTRD